MLLACIVIAHGAAASLDAAIDSVEGDVELVVVHSGGPAPDVSARLVHSEELLMPGAARNRGVAATEAPFVAFLAADCRALPGWAHGRIREHDNGADAVADVLDPPAAPTPRAAWLMQHRRRTARTPDAQRLPLGLSYRRELLLAAGPFDEHIRQGEDSALNSRLLDLGARVAYPTDVRIAHAYPDTARGVLRDARARGGRRVAAERAIGGAGRPQVLREALHVIGDAPRLERDPRVLALTAVAVGAYAAGVLGPRPRGSGSSRIPVSSVR